MAAAEDAAMAVAVAAAQAAAEAARVVRSPPVSPSPAEPQEVSRLSSSGPPLPTPPPATTRLYKGWGLREAVKVLHSTPGDLKANPPQLALDEGEEITLTSMEPGQGWWTAVARERCGVVPAGLCHR